MRVLVTGGAGYIGSHTCLMLLKAGHDVAVVDNLKNGSIEALERVQSLSNRKLIFTRSDVRNCEALDCMFDKFNPDAVIHFAGQKSVVESVSDPVSYYDINVGGTATLLGAMDRAGCVNIIFSSSATVYGKPKYLPCDERHPLEPINPYGYTKLVGEVLLRDWANAGQGRKAVALRYFNPVGADPSGQIGEHPNGRPNNLMPIISQIAIGKIKYLEIFGGDYDTIDGTGVRDYIHVSDLAEAHIAAVEKIHTLGLFEAINVGTGVGLSVYEIVREFEKQSKRKIPFKVSPRRLGDAPAVWADVSLANKKIGFTAARDLSEMCQDTWRWQLANPFGYNK